ncbi:hypothetical protein, partial [Salmonella enterica]
RYLSSARDRDILRMRGDGMLTSKEAKNNANNHSLQACQSGTWGTIGGKLKVTQLSTTGYLGQFDFCAIARMGNAEDAHYCQVVESPAGSRKWYKYEHKTGCIASCVTLN